MFDRIVSTVDLSWFLDLRRNDQLNLDPPYQRRSVWTPKDRRYFLDTIFRGYPSPPIFIHKHYDEVKQKHIYDVVDGKQRLETVILFVTNKITLDAKFGDTNLNGMKWQELGSDNKSRLWNYVVSTEQIRIVDAALVNNVFDRLNRNSRKLEPQELRHAKFDGWFISIAERESEDPYWRKLKVVTTARARRMKDVQILSELFRTNIKKTIVGFDHEDLDEWYGKWDQLEESQPEFNEEEFEERLHFLKEYLNAMEQANNCVTKYASTTANLFSLWAIISIISDLPEPHELANRYANFMSLVKELAGHDDLEEFLRNQEDKTYSLPHKYLQASRGASTEEPQRLRRHDALVEALHLI